MLAMVVTIQQSLRDAGAARLQHGGIPGHKRYVLEHDGVMSGLSRTAAPDEGSVSVHQHCGYGKRIDSHEASSDGFPCIENVVPLNLLIGESFRDGYGAVEVVSVSRAEGRNLLAGLGPGSGVGGVGVDDRPDARKLAIEMEVRVEIG